MIVGLLDYSWKSEY
jgi:hypothetical protein